VQAEYLSRNVNAFTKTVIWTEEERRVRECVPAKKREHKNRKRRIQNICELDDEVDTCSQRERWKKGEHTDSNGNRKNRNKLK